MNVNVMCKINISEMKGIQALWIVAYDKLNID